MGYTSNGGFITTEAPPMRYANLIPHSHIVRSPDARLPPRPPATLARTEAEPMADLSRRSILGAFLVVVASRMPAAASDGILPAVRWAEKADAAYLASGRIAADLASAGRPMPAGWTAYRASLARERRMARLDLYALTPTTPESAAALVTYHTARPDRGRGRARSSEGHPPRGRREADTEVGDIRRANAFKGNSGSGFC